MRSLTEQEKNQSYCQTYLKKKEESFLTKGEVYSTEVSSATSQLGSAHSQCS